MSDPANGASAPTEVPLGHMDALPAGTMLGEFELQGLLGVGGFGMVYRGYDHSLQRAVAIKEYMPSALVARAPGLQVSARSTSDAQPFQMGLASFIAEARLLAQFDHPSLVKVYRFWEANNTAYMAMPLYSGITLKQARSRMSGPPSESWLRTVLWSVLEALKVLHGNGTLHRDVSPDNIFLQDIGPPVLLDLGAARRAIVDGAHKHTAILKVNYAPIEQYADAEDLREGPWTDLYAVAAVVHGCLCNEPPLPATFRVLRDRMPSVARIAQTVETHFGQSYSPEFVQAMDHALVIQPSKRPQSVKAFADELQLHAPEDLSQFDWRQQLGRGVSLLDAAPAQAYLPTQLHAPSTEKTRPDPRTQAHSAVTLPPPAGASRRAAEPVVAGHARRQGAVGSVGGWGLLVAALVMGVGYLGWQWTQKAAAPPVAAVVPASSSVVALPAATPQPVPTPAPVVTTPRQPPPAPRESGRAAPEKAERKLAAAPAKADRPAAAKPPVSQDGAELCADSNLLTRSLCIHRECQKPELASRPVCVEDRQRWDNLVK
ncbi:MAG: protein kinase [Rhodoferax sp.]